MTLPKLKPYLESRSILDGLMTHAYFQTFMGDIDQNQFQPTINQPRVLQGNNVAINQAVPNGEARTRHHLSTYTDDEKRWLAITADEERSKGTGFMIRLKRRWDEQYPEKNHISKQNLRDNAARFKKELLMNDNRDDQQMEIDQDNILNNVSKWTNEMKVNLLEMEKRERNQGRGFMKRMKEAWDAIYENSMMSAQTLKDNSARFRKDKSLPNLIEVREGDEIGQDEIRIRAIKQERSEVNVERNENNERRKLEQANEEEDDDTRIMRLRFEDILNTLTPTTKENIEQRERLLKIKRGISKSEIDRANKILDKHLDNIDNICKVVDAVYAIGRMIEERKGLKRKEKRKGKKNNLDGPNRRIRKLEKHIKELRQILAWTSNEIHRQRVKRKSTKKEREIFQKLKEWANQQLNRNEDLIYVKEKALDELIYRNIKLKRIKIKDARILNNIMFQEDQGMFYRKTQGTKQLKGKVPKIEKFEEFWAGIREDDTKTPQRKWMNTIARKITENITNVQELVITEEILYGTAKKRKNWSAPGINGIPNFYWKKYMECIVKMF